MPTGLASAAPASTESGTAAEPRVVDDRILAPRVESAEKTEIASTSLLSNAASLERISLYPSWALSSTALERLKMIPSTEFTDYVERVGDVRETVLLEHLKNPQRLPWPFEPHQPRYASVVPWFKNFVRGKVSNKDPRDRRLPIAMGPGATYGHPSLIDGWTGVSSTWRRNHDFFSCLSPHLPAGDPAGFEKCGEQFISQYPILRGLQDHGLKLIGVSRLSWPMHALTETGRTTKTHVSARVSSGWCHDHRMLLIDLGGQGITVVSKNGTIVNFPPDSVAVCDPLLCRWRPVCKTPSCKVLVALWAGTGVIQPASPTVVLGECFEEDVVFLLRQGLGATGVGSGEFVRVERNELVERYLAYPIGHDNLQDVKLCEGSSIARFLERFDRHAMSVGTKGWCAWSSISLTTHSTVAEVLRKVRDSLLLLAKTGDSRPTSKDSTVLCSRDLFANAADKVDLLMTKFEMDAFDELPLEAWFDFHDVGTAVADAFKCQVTMIDIRSGSSSTAYPSVPGEELKVVRQQADVIATLPMDAIVLLFDRNPEHYITAVQAPEFMPIYRCESLSYLHSLSTTVCTYYHYLLPLNHDVCAG